MLCVIYRECTESTTGRSVTCLCLDTTDTTDIEGNWELVVHCAKLA